MLSTVHPDRIIIYLFALLLSYLIGSIPTGYWLAKHLKGIDIRQIGSGSTGATNVYRNVGQIGWHICVRD